MISCINKSGIHLARLQIFFLPLEGKGQHRQRKHHQTKELRTDQIPGPFTKQIEQRGDGRFLVEVHKIGAQERIDAQHKDEIEVRPQKRPTKTLPGRTETVHKNGVENALNQAEVHDEEAKIEVVREALLQGRGQQGVHTSPDHDVVGNLKKEKIPPPEHERQHQVDEITDVERQHQTQINGSLKQEHIQRNQDPKHRRNEALNQSDTPLPLFGGLFFAEPDPEDRAQYTNYQPEKMLQAVALKSWCGQIQGMHGVQIECRNVANTGPIEPRNGRFF